MLKKILKVVLIIACIAVIICVMAFIGLGGCESKEKRSENAKKYILQNSGIEIPSDTTPVYNCTDDNFVNGRHASFNVFEFKNEPTAWLEENKFLRSDDETLVDEKGGSLVYKNEGHFLDYLGEARISTMKGVVKIPDEYIPNFKISYLWTCPKNVYFFYYPETLRLTVYVAWS